MNREFLLIRNNDDVLAFENIIGGKVGYKWHEFSKGRATLYLTVTYQYYAFNWLTELMDYSKLYTSSRMTFKCIDEFFKGKDLSQFKNIKTWEEWYVNYVREYIVNIRTDYGGSVWTYRYTATTTS